MLSQRLKDLALEEIIHKKLSDEDYQVAMAKKLRALACDYLTGKLKGILDDGPAVKTLRQFIADGHLEGIKDVEQFATSQARDAVWVEQMNFVVEELLECNIALATDASLKKGFAPNTWDKKDYATTLAIKNNDRNTHWEAIINDKAVRTKGDGNCYYNAVALSLKHEVNKKSINDEAYAFELAGKEMGTTDKDDIIAMQAEILRHWNKTGTETLFSNVNDPASYAKQSPGLELSRQ